MQRVKHYYFHSNAVPQPGGPTMPNETNPEVRPSNRIEPVEGVHRAIRIVSEDGLDLKEDPERGMGVVLLTEESTPASVNATAI
jgi:hypothetical protein